MAKYNVYDQVLIPARIVEQTSTEDGDFYKVRIVANNKAQIIFMEEDEISGGVTPTPTPDPEPTPEPEPEPTPEPEPEPEPTPDPESTNTDPEPTNTDPVTDPTTDPEP